MKIIPITFKTACDFIKQHHRHHAPTVGCKFCVGCENEGELVGVAVEALEKQVPFNPTRIKKRKEYNCKFGNCKCGERVIDAYGYCSKCGQALDWSDTE